MEPLNSKVLSSHTTHYKKPVQKIIDKLQPILESDATLKECIPKQPFIASKQPPNLKQILVTSQLTNNTYEGTQPCNSSRRATCPTINNSIAITGPHGITHNIQGGNLPNFSAFAPTNVIDSDDFPPQYVNSQIDHGIVQDSSTVRYRSSQSGHHGAVRTPLRPVSGANNTTENSIHHQIISYSNGPRFLISPTSRVSHPSYHVRPAINALTCLQPKSDECSAKTPVTQSCPYSNELCKARYEVTSTITNGDTRDNTIAENMCEPINSESFLDNVPINKPYNVLNSNILTSNSHMIHNGPSLSYPQNTECASNPKTPLVRTTLNSVYTVSPTNVTFATPTINWPDPSPSITWSEQDIDLLSYPGVFKSPKSCNSRPVPVFPQPPQPGTSNESMESSDQDEGNLEGTGRLTIADCDTMTNNLRRDQRRRNNKESAQEYRERWRQHASQVQEILFQLEGDNRRLRRQLSILRHQERQILAELRANVNLIFDLASSDGNDDQYTDPGCYGDYSA